MNTIFTSEVNLLKSPFSEDGSILSEIIAGFTPAGTMKEETSDTKPAWTATAEDDGTITYTYIGPLTISVPLLSPGEHYFTVTATSENGSTVPVSWEPEPVPENLCGNCRRDWHSIPLSKDVAYMWDNCVFPEEYDPEKDNSRIVCPGSDSCGPIMRPMKKYANKQH